MMSEPALSSATRTRPPGALEPGQVLGRYRLVVPIAAGGMGQVWAARQLGSIGMNRLVAIKTALPKMQRTEDFERLFLDEGRIAAAIAHPNVCAIYDIGNEDGELFIAMEWVNGGSLSMLLRDAADAGVAVPVGVAAKIIAHAAAGLHAAHSLTDDEGNLLHVIHRDVSPQNILVSASGHVKVADFGVAKARGQLHQATETGAFRGKVSYMAPEQFKTKHYDRRVDVYALGCVFYQLLTGDKPFDDEEQLVVMYKVVEGSFVKPSARRADIPPELEAIVLRAMSHRQDERWATAGDFGRAIESWLLAAGEVVGEQDIADFVQTCSGARIDARMREVRAAVEQLSAGPISGEGSLRTPQVALEVPSNVRTVTASASVAPETRPLRARKTIWGPVAFALACVAVSGGAGVLYRKLKPVTSVSVESGGATVSTAPPVERPADPITPKEVVAPSPRDATNAAPTTVVAAPVSSPASSMPPSRPAGSGASIAVQARPAAAPPKAPVTLASPPAEVPAAPPSKPAPSVDNVKRPPAIDTNDPYKPQ